LAADEPAPSGSRRTLAATLTTTIGANLPAFLLGGLAVQMQADLGFGPTGVGVGVGAFFAAGAACSALTGQLVERVGPERSLRWAAALSGLVQLAIAGLGRSIGVIVAMLAVGGLANAWAQPASNVLLARVVAPGRLGVALGVQKSAIPAAALLGGLAVPSIALTVGWRWAFVAGAAFAFASAIQVPSPAADVVARRHGRREGKPDVPTKHLLFLAVGVGFGSSASNALSAFLVLSGVAAGLSEGTSGLLLTAGSVAGIGVRLLVGSRADRYPGRTLAAMAVMFAIASTSFALLATGVEALFLIATPLAFATAYAWPGLFHLAVVRTNPSAPGAATGLTMTGTLTGAVAGPVLFGFIATHGSYGAAWLVGAAFLVAAALVVGLSSRLIREPSPIPVTAHAA
jgi:predicted MFS family arabinose efflux permease